MRTMVTVLAAVLAGCSSRAPEPAPADPAVLAGTAAQQVMAGVPRDLGGGVAVAGAKAEGRVLVLALTGMTDWRPNYTDASMATTMERGICFLPGVAALTRGGGSVRLQSETAARVALPPLAITRC